MLTKWRPQAKPNAERRACFKFQSVSPLWAPSKATPEFEGCSERPEMNKRGRPRRPLPVENVSAWSELAPTSQDGLYWGTFARKASMLSVFSSSKHRATSGTFP